MTTSTLPTVTAPRIDRPLPLASHIPTFRPILPNVSANRGQFTNLIQLYQSVKTLEQQLAPLAANINCILSQLNPTEQVVFTHEIQMFKILQQLAANAKENADRKFNEQVSALQVKKWTVNKSW